RVVTAAAVRHQHPPILGRHYLAHFLVAVLRTDLIDRRCGGLKGHQVGRLAPHPPPRGIGMHGRCFWPPSPQLLIAPPPTRRPPLTWGRPDRGAGVARAVLRAHPRGGGAPPLLPPQEARLGPPPPRAAPPPAAVLGARLPGGRPPVRGSLRHAAVLGAALAA